MAPLFSNLEKLDELPDQLWSYAWNAFPNTFEGHVRIVAHMLTSIEPNAAKKSFKQGVVRLHVYVLRACLGKILRCASYHSMLFHCPLSNHDYPAKLPLSLGTWSKATGRLRERFRGHSEILQELLSASSKMAKGFSQPVDWTSTGGLDEKTLQSYEPNAFEKNAIKMLYEEHFLTDQHFPGKGFYLDPRGRELYHDVFTLNIALSLVCLKALEHFHSKGEIVKALDMEGGLFDLVKLCEKLLRVLDGLVSYSPLLFVHLTWFLRQQRTLPEDVSASEGPIQDERKTMADNNDEREEVLLEENADHRRHSRPGLLEDDEDDEDDREGEGEEEEEANILPPDDTASSRHFSDGTPAYVKAIIRWLRLLTPSERSQAVAEVRDSQPPQGARSEPRQYFHALSQQYSAVGG